MCAQACMHACVCGFTYRQKDDLVHKLRYGAVNKLLYYLPVFPYFSLSTYLYTHTQWVNKSHRYT